MTERRKKGEYYWHLMFDIIQGSNKRRWAAVSVMERDDAFDREVWEAGNYYTDKEEANAEARRRNAEIEEEIARERAEKKACEKALRKEAKRRKGSPVVESEKDVERYLVRQTGGMGWLPLKYSSGIATGYPDRCILIPGGRTVWVEVKTTGMQPTRLQSVRLKQLQNLGFATAVVDSRGSVDALIRHLQSNLKGDAVHPA